MKNLRHAVIGGLLLTLVGCSDAASAPNNTPGFCLREYVDPEGQSHRYSIYIPFKDGARARRPVILFLNGFQQNGQDGILQLSRNLGPEIWEMRAHFPFIVIAPQCRRDQTWSPNGPDAQRAMKILDEVVKEFDADLDRIYLTGVSTGGIGAWDIGSENADRFAAIVPLCGNGESITSLVQSRMPLWHFVNDGDDSTLVDGAHRRRTEMLTAGLSPHFTEFNQEGHDCWTAAYKSPELYQWLLGQRRSQRSKSELFEYFPPDRLINEWKHLGEGQWKIDPVNGAVIGTADRGRGALISTPKWQFLEFHGDLHLSANVTYEIAFSPAGDTGDKGRITVALCASSAGTGGVFRRDNHNWLVPLSPTSQESLQVGRWNDIRLRLDQHNLIGDINGWRAFSVELEKADFDGAKISCALMAPHGREVRWKDVRVRRVASSNHEGAL